MAEYEELYNKDEDKDRIRKMVKDNLRNLCSVKGITQQKLGEILGVAGKSTVSNYLNPESDSIPDITSLYQLKEYFGIPLDSLLSPSFDPKNSFEIDGVNISHYDKFLGVYIVYYLSSNKLSPIPNEYNKPILSYAVLAIVKDNNGIVSVSSDAYKTFACFSFKSSDKALELKEAAETAFRSGDINAVRNVFANRERYSEGNFELILQGKLYSMTMTGYSLLPANKHRSITDKISVLGFNPPNTDTSRVYIGGGMLCSSVSRGLHKCPCSQLMLASRTELNEDEQEIIRRLQKHHQYFNSEKIASDSISRLQKLKATEYEEGDKETLLHSFIKNRINDELNNNVTQLFYIVSEEDQLFYQFLKDSQKTGEK